MSDSDSLDRRRFLARLGSMSALGAAYLTFGDRGKALARVIPAGTPAPRPIYMLSLGDSIMWGQGLSEPQKFRNLVGAWIRDNNPERRQVVQFNYAHSGASLGYFPFGLYGQTSRSLRVRRLRARAKVDPTGTRDLDVAELEGDWPNDSTAARIDRDSAATTDRRPHPVPTDEEQLGGEMPRGNPILWRQMDMAVADLQTKSIAPEDIDLVLLDGGANDADFLLSVLNPNWTPNWVEFQTRELVKQRMQGFLPWALKSFPNAKFVVTGYYQGVSPLSSPGGLTPLVLGMAPVYSALGILFPIPAIVAGVLAASYINDTIGRGAAFEKGTSDGLRAAVALSGGRAVFVSPEFQPQHAYGAPQSLMFHFDQADPALAMRQAECPRAFPDFFPLVNGRPTARVPDALACLKTATFHPNPAGAQRYAEKIRAALPSVFPMMNIASRSLRLTVQGATSGATNTVTVSAVDASTGQPVTGTVTINGVRGATGAPISFRPCMPPREPIGDGVKGAPRIAPRVAATMAGAEAVACTGTVTAPGYPVATFEY